MSNFKVNNTPLGMLALYGTPQQLKQKLESREPSKSNLNTNQTKNLVSDYGFMEGTILEMMEYDRIFGSQLYPSVNPFKMVEEFPEDTTDYDVDYIEYLNQQVIRENELQYLTDSSDLSDGSDSESEFVQV